LLDRIHDPRDQEAWAEFVALYGPLVFQFARRRLPQDEDAADVMQEVLGAVLRGTYQRTNKRFQKWLVTVILNKVRDFHAARVRRHELSGGPAVAERLQEEPSRSEEEEWDQERARHLFRAASDRVQARTSAVHWEVFTRTALENQPGQDVARALDVSLTNVYAIKSRIMKEIRDEIRLFGED
jgi:RNA polymerase sigma-70 factor (ECF subfamily)